MVACSTSFLKGFEALHDYNFFNAVLLQIEKTRTKSEK